MVNRLGRAHIWINSSLLLLSVVLWLFLAPQQYGGQNAYILVHGISMEPNFSQDDLVVVRQANQYRVGDVVAYHHKQIGTVLHRIMELEGETFVLQGDNNDFIDSYFPVADEIIGVEMVHLPQVGRVLEHVRERPKTLAIVAGAIVFIAFFGLSVAPGGLPGLPVNRNEGTAVTYYRNNYREEWLSLLVFLIAFCALGTWIAYNRPLQRSDNERIDYKQQISFTYSAMANGDVYDAAIITAGEPVFRQLNDSMTVGVRYQVLPGDSAEINGTYQMHAEIRDVNGWKRTLELIPETPFDAATVDLAADISFAELQAIIENVQSQTGVERSQYQLRILPRFAFDGKVQGEQFSDAFSAELEFEFTDLELRPRADPLEEDAGLTHTETGQVLRPIKVPNTYSLLSFEFPIETMRQYSSIGLATGLIVLLGFIIDGMRLRRKSSAEQRPPHLDELSIMTGSDPFTLSTTRIPLQSFDDLMRIAQHSNQVILRHNDRFAVLSEQVLYYYSSEAPEETAVPQPAVEKSTRKAIA